MRPEVEMTGPGRTGRERDVEAGKKMSGANGIRDGAAYLILRQRVAVSVEN